MEDDEYSDSAMEYLFQPEGVYRGFEAQDNGIIFDLIVFPILELRGNGLGD